MKQIEYWLFFISDSTIKSVEITMNELLSHPYFKYYPKKIAIVGYGYYFLDFRTELQEEFINKGINCSSFDGFQEIDKPLEYDCIIVINPNEHLNVRRNKNTVLVAIQTEQLFNEETGPFCLGKTQLEYLKQFISNYDIVFDFCDNNLEVIRKTSKKKDTLLALLPSPFFCKNNHGFDNNVNHSEKYDLLFIGNSKTDFISVEARRSVIMKTLKEKYKVFPESKGLWGRDKVNAIANSKICINLHSEEGRYVETTRLAEYFSLNSFVLSERCSPCVFIDGYDYVSFSLYDIFEKIDYYLDHSTEREEIANHAYEKMKTLSMEKNANAILDKLVMKRYLKYVKNSKWMVELRGKILRAKLSGIKQALLKMGKGKFFYGTKY